ncbi:MULTISPECIES: HigA family addiction module antitoxin [Gordonia]|uniref:HigA family addiction module antitoxin n=1 Tax=Gordonia TaxID=2053 RepID=UPI001AD77691|nr:MULTISPECIES: HigA family addiction module antitoxin [Gordonia]QTI70807.1 HigA family addiction module antidote protein [Gordonia polyisoprenivorans]WCB38849.1 HigA family addiction module antitoxin [Gordonia polyisoprenivorans]WHU45650.1 HigA family addiction module antitoxin [Gordonia sp. L191]
MPDFEPIHPGETLAADYLPDYGLSQRKLAELIHVPPRRINEIIHGRRAITPDTSIRLGRLFGQSETFWLNMQTRYDLEIARATTDVSDITPLAS